MKKQPTLSVQCLIAMTVYGFIGCATNPVKTQQPLELENVGGIELHIEAADSSVLTAELNKQVNDNLTGWHYPIKAQEGRPVSHKLIATIAAIEHTDTPTGFSFSAGNSDPRAMNFQKAEVLPIHCQLTAIKHPEQTGELSMGFTVSTDDKRSLKTHKLADRISTVCFNLLREVKWPQSVPASQAESKPPRWMPEIRIEETQDAAPMASDPKSPSSAEAAEKPNSTRLSDNGTPRKQIVIHNQGSPVILHWGHERR